MNDIDPDWPYRRNGRKPITEPEVLQKKLRRPRRNRKIILWVIAVVFTLACIATVGYFIKRNNDLKKENERLSQPEDLAKKQQDDLLQTVGKIVELPQDETPTTATVTDLGKLEGQVFFEKAQIGDKVIIYTKSKMAYLYRPSSNRIINIAPVNLGQGQ